MSVKSGNPTTEAATGTAVAGVAIAVCALNASAALKASR